MSEIDKPPYGAQPPAEGNQAAHPDPAQGAAPQAAHDPAPAVWSPPSDTPSSPVSAAPAGPEAGQPASGPAADLPTAQQPAVPPVPGHVPQHAAGQPQYPGYPAGGYQTYPQAGGYPHSGGYPQAGGYPTGGYPTAQHAYGTPTGATWTPPGSQQQQKGSGLGGTIAKIAIGSVAAVVLAVGSGIAGAVIATRYADDGKITVSTGSTAAAPVIDRGSLSAVAAALSPSVVNISTGSGEGSGIVLTEDGYIVTNNHVVAGAAGREVTVTLADGKKVKATIVGTDPRTDLGVVKAEAKGLKFATFGNSDQVAVGDTVLAIGSPLGLQGSVTAGIISARDRTISVGENRGTSLSGLLQTDAPINPGNSGGALVNTKGEIVGINTAIATNGSGDGNIGVGFAIPSNKAKSVAEQIMNGKPVSHPYLGVSVTAADTGGASVGSVSENSPAAKAGLQKGDVITKFAGRIINDSDDLVSAVQSGTVGQQVTVEFTRNGEAKTATVTLGEAS
ncbi:trypsin-like peptidase domain-containing protein [Catellatospora sp. KI3]|uniref:S1C family serine protease n=1 Tax=Catellatospora sp. KI3 TaxID=3041620 RepID=UPI002482CA93|nr:trypsin-like peptidase domain-containing protein [Catellatospora sp. KI3]MDI1459764.1 trypsin-like peptidase domain-containing protein [Catellatospora sp. KI3]